MRKRLNRKKIIIFLAVVFVMLFTVFYNGEKKESGTKTVANVGDAIENTRVIQLAARSTGNSTPRSSGGVSPTGTGEDDSDTVSSVTGGGTYYLAKGESRTLYFAAYNSAGKIVVPSWSLTSDGGNNASMSSSGSLSIGPCEDGGAGKNCKTFSYTVTASLNETSGTGTGSVCVYCKAWDCVNGNWYYTSQKSTKNPKTSAGCSYYEGESKVEGGYQYTKYCTRCCSDTPAKSDGACYGNKEYLGLATDAKWYLTDSQAPSGYYKYTKITKPEDCVTKKVNLCTESSGGVAKQTVATNDCEDTAKVEQTERVSCGNVYKIVCTRTVKTSFDFEDDGDNDTSRVIYKGQGFRFGVTAKINYTCDAELYYDRWKSIYNTLIDKIKAIDSSLITYVDNNDADGWVKAVNALKAKTETKKELYSLWYQLVKELRDIVAEKYMNFTPAKFKYNEKVDINMEYLTKENKKIRINDNFEKRESESRDGAYTRKNSSTTVNLKMNLNNIPTSYSITNSSTYTAKYVPKRAQIDRYANMDSNKKTIDGGNKIYVDYNIQPTKNNQSYKMTIKYTGFDSVGSSISDNKCDIKVNDDVLTYRPIDVANPLINDNHGIGGNWLNNTYDFVNVIDADTWSATKKAQYKIVVPSSKVVSLKNSTAQLIKNGYSPYLGMCDGVKTSLQDSITKEICAILNK